MYKIILITLLAFPTITLARPSLTPEQCLASSIHFEARGEPMAGKKAVMDVILNRARKWSMSVCEVVFQRRQFSFVSKQTKWLSKEKSEDILSVMDFVDSNISEDTLFFHATYVKPGWGKRLVKERKIGRHIFFKDKLRKQYSH